jgi:hypothetical protein
VPAFVAALESAVCGTFYDSVDSAGISALNSSNNAAVWGTVKPAQRSAIVHSVESAVHTSFFAAFSDSILCSVGAATGIAVKLPQLPADCCSDSAAKCATICCAIDDFYIAAYQTANIPSIANSLCTAVDTTFGDSDF